MSNKKINADPMMKARKKLMEENLKKPETPFAACDLPESQFVPPGLTRAFANNLYMVMVFDNALTSHGPAIQVMVQKIDDTIIARHWKEMQRIKNELFGPQTWAVEYYPAESRLMDQHNIFWFWVYPAGILPIPLI